jgi:hypothetical protein
MNFRTVAQIALEKDQERAKFAAIAANRAKIEQDMRNREETRRVFQQFLDANHANSVRFEAVGKDRWFAVLTDDNVLISMSNPAQSPPMWFWVWGRCPDCGRLVKSVDCRTMADIGEQLVEFKPAHGMQACGRVDDPMALFTNGWCTLDEDAARRFYHSQYGYYPEEMLEHFGMTRQGPVVREQAA